MTISERILSASTDAEAREVLEALWRATQFPPFYEGVCNGDCPICVWDRKRDRFSETLDARAYLSAAEMLVPEGWLIVQLSDIGLAGGCMCALGNPGTSADVVEDTGARERWQALAAAIAKTREG